MIYGYGEIEEEERDALVGLHAISEPLTAAWLAEELPRVSLSQRDENAGEELRWVGVGVEGVDEFR